MDDVPESSSTLPWLWTIEALASSEEVDISLIHDVVETAPELPDDEGKKAREMVALRCLEGLFGPRNGTKHGVPSEQEPKVRFNLTETCEDVLQRILDGTPESDLRMARAKMLRWDVTPFIKQRRTSVPKCTLQQLKEKILDGTHPHADFLRGKSGLVPGSNDERNDLNYGDRSESNGRADGSCSSAQIARGKGNTNLLVTEGEKVSEESSPNGMAQNLCMKCHEGGQLLACSARNCPLVVHEKCLCSKVMLGKKVDFFCPFCAYANALSEYGDAKKTASLAKKELAAFIRLLKHRPKDLTEQSHEKEYIQYHTNEDECSRKRVNNKTKQNDQDLDHRTEVPDLQCSDSGDDNHRVEPSTSFDIENAECRETEVNFEELPGVFGGKKDESKQVRQGCQSVLGTERPEDKEVADHQSGAPVLSSKKLGILSDNPSQAETGAQGEISNQQKDNVIERPIYIQGNDAEQSSENFDDDSSMNNYFVRFRRRRDHYSSIGPSQSRRRKVPWTEEEEEKLKEGVRLFSSVDERVIPWKKILEFGSAVFLTERTPIDLKDKWRNICSRPKPK